MTLKRLMLSISVLLSTMVLIIGCQSPAPSGATEPESACSVTTYLIDPFSGEQQLYCIE